MRDTHFYYDDNSTGYILAATAGYGHYNTTQELVKNMNEVSKQEIGNDTTIYNTQTGKVTIKLYLFGKLSLIMGYSGKNTIIDSMLGPVQESPYVAHFSTFTSIYTYCNIFNHRLSEI
jgi:hypothetical protein